MVNYEQKSSPPLKRWPTRWPCAQSVVNQIAAQQRYLASLNITLQRATALYRHGAVSYIEVLGAQRDISPPDKPCWNSTIPVRANEITLFTALGGGWME